jgi:putative ABC transport system ATP-binding protein
LLTAETVSMSRSSGRSIELILDAISFDIVEGEYVGVRGPRRSGKTTLLRTAAGIETPQAGRISWRGRAVSELSRRKRTRWLREIAFVGQTHDWRAAPGKPMLDHVALPLVISGKPVAEALATARAVAERVGAENFVHELPPDVLTRLALARALVRDPLLLVVDDLGGGGSDAEQQALQQQLLALMRERPQMAVLASSRDATSLRGASRVMSLDGSGQLRVPEREAAQIVQFPAGAPGS